MHYLDREIREFVRSNNKSRINTTTTTNNNNMANVGAGAAAARTRKTGGASWCPQQPTIRMPTQRELITADRSDLVSAIKAAGGFTSVAQALGFRGPRRPRGYWDDLENLDEEINLFVAANWTMHTIEDTGEVYYYNAINYATTFDEPHPDEVVLTSCEPADEDALPVMPTNRDILAAGRWDLHHAIVLHGGYREVAQALNRQRARRARETLQGLEMDMQALMEEKQLSRLPTAVEFARMGRQDLVYYVQERGGFPTTAKALGVRSQRRERRYWEDISNVEKELREYLVQKRMHQTNKKDQKPTPSLRMPTHAELLSAGRSDLRYALQLHGHQVLVQRLGLQRASRGAHNRAPNKASQVAQQRSEQTCTV
eukprot:jgi/Chlat1/3671/Chrsp24S03843